MLSMDCPVRSLHASLARLVQQFCHHFQELASLRVSLLKDQLDLEKFTKYSGFTLLQLGFHGLYHVRAILLGFIRDSFHFLAQIENSALPHVINPCDVLLASR